MTDDYVKRNDVNKAMIEWFKDNGDRRPWAEVINGIPAADVWPVVRCKDCKHRPSMKTDEIGGRVLVFPGDDANPCPCQNFDDDWYSYEPDDDFFCAYGAKMDAGKPRVLGYDEIEGADAVWLEIRHTNGIEIEVTAFKTCGERMMGFEHGFFQSIPLYGKQWRCWSKKPTREQMEKEEWKK